MKLIILYGPPAVGKLTVAKELAKKTGIRLFHNHLSVDLVASIIPFEHKDFWPEVRRIRRRLLKLSAKEGNNLIYTIAYRHDLDDKNLSEYLKIYEDQGGEICLVHLTARKEEIFKRMKDGSRLNTFKMKDEALLTDHFSKYDFFTPVNGRKSLSIDNSSITPADTADLIIKEFKL